MTGRAAVVVALLVAAQGAASAQTRTAPAARAAARKPTVESAMVKCPNVLGTGVKTQREFCDVLTGRDPADGIVIDLPPHSGPVTLTFDLHNRHMYSDELIRANRAYRRYTATIGVLTADNTLLSRAVVQNEFRSASDLVDRIGGGAGPGGVKAVAPTGSEAVAVTIPADEMSVSILGEKLSVVRLDGVDNFTLPGQVGERVAQGHRHHQACADERGRARCGNVEPAAPGTDEETEHEAKQDLDHDGVASSRTWYDG